MGQDDIMLAFLPFHHVYGLSVFIMRATFALKPVVIMAKLDLEKYCQLIQKYKVTIAGLVPPVTVLLAKSPVVPRYDLTSLRMITYSAAPLGKDHIEQLHKRIKVPVRQA